MTALLGVWFVAGLCLDSWAHNNLAELETFFTPWHGVFYSGFMATGAWICWAVLRNLLAGRSGVSAVPVGYGLALLALPVFAVAGAGDWAWHTGFGIEQDINILFSPTHVVLVSTMIVIVTAPLRSVWGGPASSLRPTLRRLFPAVLTVALATTLVLLFVQYGNAFAYFPEYVVRALSSPGDGPRPNPGEVVSAVAITTAVLLTPILLMARRWRVPPGTATLTHVTVAGLVGAITAFAVPWMLVVVLLAGVCADALLVWLRPGEGGRRGPVLAYAALYPLITWSLYIGLTAVDAGRLPSVVEMWTGVPVVAALLGLALGVVAAPHPPVPAAEQSPAPVG